MIQTSIYALIGILLGPQLQRWPYFTTSLIIGLIFPDIDVVFDFILSLFLNFNFGQDTYIYNSPYSTTTLLYVVRQIFQQDKKKRRLRKK